LGVTLRPSLKPTFLTIYGQPDRIYFLKRILQLGQHAEAVLQNHEYQPNIDEFDTGSKQLKSPD
tara:strand:- start:3033 stop:3224 length:192 start_codon:yes stop_codon:yes gene_type:complete